MQKMSEEELKMHMDRLSKMAVEFNRLYDRKEYSRAHWILLKAEVIAGYLNLPRQNMSELFGYWEDDGRDDTVPPGGLFDRDKARVVDWQCCVKAHKGYQDIANRLNGVPLQH